jgi:SAM-dependent methyltransferase
LQPPINFPTLPIHKIASNLLITDAEFDSIYTFDIHTASEIHFTPVDVSIAAARYLAHFSGTRVLDIGSGAGKFCFIGAACTAGIFTGVEMRHSFNKAASDILEIYGLTNVEFLQANITTITFTDYDAFYIFNPFQENISISDRINDEIPLNKANYTEYSTYVRNQLDTMPFGTRVVTYFSHGKELPESYHLQGSDFSGKLKFWQKIK